MATVDNKSANWRLYGGGGLLVGGVLWILSIILVQAATSAELGKWLLFFGLLVVAVGFFVLAWGQTGSNGVVGGNMLGKVGLWAAAIGFLLWALATIVAGMATSTLFVIVALLIVIGTFMAAIGIMQKGIAKGLGKWAMFLVFLLALLFFLGVVASVAALTNWVVALIFAIVVALTGLIYLMNRR